MEHTRKDPSYKQAMSQAKKICSSEEFKDRTTAANLLKYLINITIAHKGPGQSPFVGDHQRPTGEEILKSFYDDQVKHFNEARPKDPPVAGRKLVSDLRVALQEYYGEAPDPGLKGPIKIEIPIGKQSPYRPTFEWIPSPVSTSSTDGAGNSSRVGQTSNPGTASANMSESSLPALNLYRRKWHHYYLTLNPSGTPVWIYNVINFKENSPDGRRLVTKATMLPERGENPKDHQYEIEAALHGPHLVLQIRRFQNSPDMGIELFPHVPQELPSLYSSRVNQTLYSVQINHTWHGRTVASSVGILCSEARAGITEEGPVSQSHAKKLQTAWDAHSKKNSDIVQLPFRNGFTAHSGKVEVKEKWDQGRFNELLDSVEHKRGGADKRKKGDLWIATTIIINESDLRLRLERCLMRGMQVKLLVMDTQNRSLFDARFRYREDGYTPDKAIEELREQIGRFIKLPSDLKESRGSCSGTIDIRVSNLTPAGFTVHCCEWGVIGLMPAYDSYEQGPMIECDSATEIWKMIDLDWKARWSENKPVKEGIHYKAPLPR